MALVVGKVNALLGFGRTANPTGLRTRKDPNQPQQKVTHQLR
jgi:hypothetical protein